MTISSHENSVALNPFPGYPLNLAIPKTTKGWLGTSIFGHIQPDGMRPIGTTGASDVFDGNFSSLRWAAKCGMESCCLLYPDILLQSLCRYACILVDIVSFFGISAFKSMELCKESRYDICVCI